MNRRPSPLVLILCVALAATAVFLAAPARRPHGERLMIACGEDLAGQIVAYVARTGSARVSSVGMKQLSFLQLSDCCGTQAEFVLAGGDFDMAVLCPDAAQKFLASGVPFRVFGGLVKNANVLVARDVAHPRTVGYMNGRDLQKQAVFANLGQEVRLHPIAAPALPYALECGAVDAVVLDAADAIRLPQYRNRALSCDAPSAVLVVHEALIGSTDFKEFVGHYNDTVGRLEASLCEELLPQVLGVECGEETSRAWHKMNVHLLTLPASTFPPEEG